MPLGSKEQCVHLLLAHTEMGQMRRGGFDSINVLEKVAKGFQGEHHD